VISFFIEGVPRPQPRHSVATRGKHAHAYIPTKHPIHEWKEHVRLSAAHAMDLAGAPIWEGKALRIEMTFYLPRPKHHWGTGKNRRKLKASAPKWPLGSIGDWDNYAKAPQDAMEGIVFKDDCAICSGAVEKRYCGKGMTPGAKVLVRELTVEEAAMVRLDKLQALWCRFIWWLQDSKEERYEED